MLAAIGFIRASCRLSHASTPESSGGAGGEASLPALLLSSLPGYGSPNKIFVTMAWKARSM
jgi:hypothetical protein